MAVDGATIGHVAAGAMEYLEREYADDETARVGHVVLVLTVRRGEADDAETVTHVETGDQDLPYYVAAGMLHGGLCALGMYERND